MPNDSVNRFSLKAESYDKFRPDYPLELVRLLRTYLPADGMGVVADIAAGTGIFTEQIAAWGHPVYVVEPNPYMRKQALRRLSAFDNCVFFDGTAESTGLPDNSVDLIVSAQAFHWFDLEKTKLEFRRVGRDAFYVAVVWNLRNTDTPFESGYETLIRTYAVDYLNVSQRKMDTREVLSFFAPVLPEYRIFGHVDFLTIEQLRGRTFSYSFMPDQTSPIFPEVLESLTALFNEHHHDGRVRLSYKTRLFIGRLNTDH